MYDHKLAIAIVSHHQEMLVLDLLKSLEVYQPDFDFEILILENTEFFPEKLKTKYGERFKILQNEKVLSLSENLNKLFALNASEYFCILNPDVRFCEEVFENLMFSMQENSIDIIAPLVKNDAGHIEDSFRSIPRPDEIVMRRLFNKGKTIQVTPDENGLMYPEWIAGIFLLMKSETFRKLNGYNEKFRLYFEDVEFCMRARMAGFQLAVDTRNEIFHDARRESRIKAKYLRFHICSAAKFFFSLDYLKFLRTKKRQKTKK